MTVRPEDMLAFIDQAGPPMRWRSDPDALPSRRWWLDSHCIQSYSGCGGNEITLNVMRDDGPTLVQSVSIDDLTELVAHLRNEGTTS